MESNPYVLSYSKLSQPPRDGNGISGFSSPFLFPEKPRFLTPRTIKCIQNAISPEGNHDAMKAIQIRRPAAGRAEAAGISDKWRTRKGECGITAQLLFFLFPHSPFRISNFLDPEKAGTLE